MNALGDKIRFALHRIVDRHGYDAVRFSHDDEEVAPLQPRRVRYHSEVNGKHRIEAALDSLRTILGVFNDGEVVGEYEQPVGFPFDVENLTA